jgi:hypothetical protein
MTRLAAIIAVSLLSACVAAPKGAPTLVRADEHRMAGGLRVTLERSWTAMPSSSATGRSYFTFDGSRLNQVHVLAGVSSGHGLVKPRNWGQKVPTFRSGMSSQEIVSLVAESVSFLGYQNVGVADLRPARLAGAAGVAFTFTAVQSTGLQYQGEAVAAETRGKLDVLLFMAPAQHYYAAYAPEVERIFASARR